MPGNLLHVGASVQCPHGVAVTMVTGNTRVLVGGMAVVTMSDTFVVAGCPFTVGSKPQPCARVQWLAPATRVLVSGQPVILRTTSGLAISADQIPNGPPTIASTQIKVSGV
jgi:hypothetical protein